MSEIRFLEQSSAPRRLTSLRVPDELRDAIDRAPDDERVLLELRLAWTGLDEAAERIAARLRVFLVTWDPLEWHDRRPARATATGDGDGFEVVLYLGLDDVTSEARESGSDIASVVGGYAASVLDVGVRYEQALVAGVYPQLASGGNAPGLLSEVGRSPLPDPPAFELVSPGWEPIGLGAIQDVVQEAFGPVDLDRSPVRLEAVDEPDPDCPACGGSRFGFPAEISDAAAQMCATHLQRANTLIDERMQRGWRSNEEGMDAILGASSMLGESTCGLTLKLLRGLDLVTDRRATATGSPEELSHEAELALAVADRLAGEPERFGELVDSERLPPHWLTELPMGLAAAGLVDEAVAVGDAYAALDAEHGATFARDVAVIVAQAGRRTDALARADVLLRDAPDDVWAHITAGDVHDALGDASEAERAFRRALALAQEHDAWDVRAALERLGDVVLGQPGREDEAKEIARAAQRADRAAFGGSRVVVAKVGRNEPCPCGSGRKHKRCCGA
jgi:hypothetical protein